MSITDPNAPLVVNLLLTDLDGTARNTVSGQVCPTYPRDQVLVPKFDQLCQGLRENNWTIAGVTNQGGCESLNPKTQRPYKSHRQAVAECRYFLKLAPWCDRVYVCPNGKMSDRDEVYVVNRWPGLWWRLWPAIHEHNGFGEHPYYQVSGKYRKPGSGMLELAIRDQTEGEYSEAASLGIKPKDMFEVQVRAVMVGDMESDKVAAQNAGVKYVPVEDFLSYDNVDDLTLGLQQVLSESA